MKDLIPEKLILKGHGSTARGLISEREDERWDAKLTITLLTGDADPQYERASFAHKEMAICWLEQKAEERGFYEVDDLKTDFETLE